MGIKFGNQPCYDPLQLKRECDRLGLPTDSWWGQANRYICPLGHDVQRLGKSLLLMRKGDLDKLNDLELHDLYFDDNYSSGAGGSMMGGQNGTVTIKQLGIIQTWCATPGYEDDPDAVHVVEVADARWFWARKQYRNMAAAPPYGVGGSIMICCSASPLWVSSSYTGLSDTQWDSASWNALGTDVWNSGTGGYTSWPGFVTAPAGKPGSMEFHSVPEPEMMSYIFGLAGHTWGIDPTKNFTSSGHHRIFQIGGTTNSNTGSDAMATKWRKQLIWDDYTEQGRLAWQPKYVRVLFPLWPPYVVSDPWWCVDTENPNMTVASGAASILQSLSYAIVHDPLVAKMGEVSSLNWSAGISNLAGINARAAEIAADYWRKLQYGQKPMRRAYRGIIPDFKPDERCSAVQWGDTGSGAMTTVWRGWLPEAMPTRFFQNPWNAMGNAAQTDTSVDNSVVATTALSGVIPPGLTLTTTKKRVYGANLGAAF